MLTSVSELADTAVRLKSLSDGSIGWPLAVLKAFRAKGVAVPSADRTKAVLQELGRRGQLVRKAKRAVHS